MLVLTKQTARDLVKIRWMEGQYSVVTWFARLIVIHCIIIWDKYMICRWQHGLLSWFFMMVRLICWLQPISNQPSLWFRGKNMGLLCQMWPFGSERLMHSRGYIFWNEGHFLIVEDCNVIVTLIQIKHHLTFHNRKGRKSYHFWFQYHCTLAPP